ncbi:hypothetical protein [Swingsia samuiensis]|uniref:Uncharacterized protein n=1 Tax=Swingsia samuiensis TaxID=1293412 RepID=A0A4Y6ULH4_9PROT|nr:hypothetical protein [Swingsia samuiensis]QDH17231.1 hypothetical protein E3D00_06410 [Swingsia samuiensis]
MNRYLTSSLTAFLMAFVLQPHKANAQETSSAKTPAPPVTYFLSNPYDSTHHKMTVSIPADYFIDGTPPTAGSTDVGFLLDVSWPSWVGDPYGDDRGALRILGGLIRPSDSDASVNHDYFIGGISVPAKKLPENYTPIPPQFIAVQKNLLPIPTGHGIQEVIRDKALGNDLNEDFYVLMGTNNIPIVWLACDKDGVVPQCKENFTFHRLQMTVSYPRSRVGSWFEIMTDVKQKILTFIKQP